MESKEVVIDSVQSEVDSEVEEGIEVSSKLLARQHAWTSRQVGYIWLVVVAKKTLSSFIGSIQSLAVDVEVYSMLHVVVVVVVVVGGGGGGGVKEEAAHMLGGTFLQSPVKDTGLVSTTKARPIYDFMLLGPYRPPQNES